MRVWGDHLAAHEIVVPVGARQLVLAPKSVGFEVDVPTTAKRALAAGSSGGILSRSAALITRLVRPEMIQVATRFDPLALESVLDAWEKNAIVDPPFAGGISVSGAAVGPLYPRAGRRLDRPRVREQLRSAIVEAHACQPLAMRNESPGVERATVDRVVAQAAGMLSHGTELNSGDGARRLSFTAAQIGSLLRVNVGRERGSLELTCATDAMKTLLDPQRGSLEQRPRSASFVIDAQDRVHVEPGVSGLILDDQAVAEAVCRAAATAEKRAELPLSAGAEPALTTALAERAGVVGLVGMFTTRHACCAPRVQNIHHIADLLDGTLVGAGETFSVNRLIGPRTTKNGFRLAPSIEDGDMVDTVGGGVSQFATTLFNALFYGGYDILERQPHSYWFTRYPMGYDATLSYPHPDIVFRNDTDAAALIKTQYSDTTITVKVYGNNGGRHVRAEVSGRQNIVPPPVELIPNRNLDAGQEKTREGGMIGWTVVVKRTLTFADGKVKQEQRKVTYKPRARRVEVHPCRIPEGMPGHTGERCQVPDNDDASPATDTGAK